MLMVITTSAIKLEGQELNTTPRVWDKAFTESGREFLELYEDVNVQSKGNPATKDLMAMIDVNGNGVVTKSELL